MKLKSVIARVVSKVSPNLYFRLSYFKNRKRFLSLKHPKDISEILISKVVNGEIDKVAYLADKYEVRKFIEEKGYIHILTKLLGCYTTPDQIDFNQLPDRFAIKMNYGAGMNIICSDINNFDKQDACRKLNNWLTRNSYSNAERHYNLIPRKIIIEEFIDDGNGGFPTDYKFMCIRGKVFCILGCSHRESEHASYSPYDTNWQIIAGYDKLNRSYASITKPKNLQDMIKIAEDLSKDFDVIRVDLFSDGNRIWFGEMTLTPAGCILHGWSQKALDDMGKAYRKGWISREIEFED